MSDQKPANKTTGTAVRDKSKQEANDSAKPSSRRQAIKRFTSYTAPAMIALISANKAAAGSPL